MQKEKDGRLDYTFEFASKASNYIRHALAVVTVGNGELTICKAREALLLYQICSIPNMGMGSAFAVGNSSANVNTLHIALGAASTGVCKACACASDQGCVIPGKFYTLATGANERRWGKMKPRLEQVVESFEGSTRYDAVG